MVNLGVLGDFWSIREAILLSNRQWISIPDFIIMLSTMCPIGLCFVICSCFTWSIQALVYVPEISSSPLQFLYACRRALNYSQSDLGDFLCLLQLIVTKTN